MDKCTSLLLKLAGFMRFFLLMGTLAALSVGCASAPAAISDANIARLNLATELHAYYYHNAELTIMTPGKALAGGGGAIGGLVSLGLGKSAGEKMVAEYGLQDPAARTMEHFLGAYREAFPKTIITSESRALDKEEMKRFKGEHTGNWLLEFTTLNWSIGYFPTDWSHYRILYLAQASLFGPERKEAVWFGKCKVEDDLEKKASLETLTADSASLLKERLDNAAQTCAETLWQQFRGGEK